MEEEEEIAEGRESEGVSEAEVRAADACAAKDDFDVEEDLRFSEDVDVVMEAPPKRGKREDQPEDNL